MAKRGYDGASVADIAKAARLTPGLVHYHFKNKQELIYECHELSMRLGDQVLKDAIASEGTGYGRVTTFIKNYISLLTDEMGAPAILLTVSSATRPRTTRSSFNLIEVIIGSAYTQEAAAA